jgi:hypothetical protein
MARNSVCHVGSIQTILRNRLNLKVRTVLPFEVWGIDKEEARVSVCYDTHAFISAHKNCHVLLPNKEELIYYILWRYALTHRPYLFLGLCMAKCEDLTYKSEETFLL